MLKRLAAFRGIFAWLFALGGLCLLIYNVAHAPVQIQHERARNIRDACEGQNKRHDDTLHGIDVLTLKRLAGADAADGLKPDQVKLRLGIVLAHLPAAQRKQVEQSLSGTAYIVDRLAPKHDCDAVVRSQVSS